MWDGLRWGRDKFLVVTTNIFDLNCEFFSRWVEVMSSSILSEPTETQPEKVHAKPKYLLSKEFCTFTWGGQILVLLDVNWADSPLVVSLRMRRRVCYYWVPMASDRLDDEMQSRESKCCGTQGCRKFTVKIMRNDCTLRKCLWVPSVVLGRWPSTSGSKSWLTRLQHKGKAAWVAQQSAGCLALDQRTIALYSFIVYAEGGRLCTPNLGSI